MNLVGPLLSAGLFVLPGCWLSFSLPLGGASVRIRLLLGIALSPLVSIGQFYALRLLGVPYAPTVITVALVNLPALVLVLRRIRAPILPDRSLWAPWLAAMLVPIVFLVARHTFPPYRSFYGHVSLHTDIIYALANGQLRPEEPLLAGVRLSYPFLSHAHQGALAFLGDLPPEMLYGIQNTILFAVLAALVAALVLELGGRRTAVWTSVLLLAFGVNPVGYALPGVLPASLVNTYPVFGDYRYAPWLWKYFALNQAVFVLAAFGGLAWLLVRAPRTRPLAERFGEIGLLLMAVAVVYPIIFPAAAALVAARCTVVLLDRSGHLPKAEIVGMGAAVAVAGAFLVTYLSVLGPDRVSPSLGFSDAWQLKIKTVRSVVVFSLLGLPAIAALFFAGGRRPAYWTLLLGALGSIALYVLFSIYNWENEYKYVYTAAICLTPLAAVALERTLEGRPRLRPWILAALCLALLTPAVHKVSSRVWAGVSPYTVRASQFAVRLGAGHSYANVTDAIRDGTPTDAVLVHGVEDMDLTTVTQRATYVPPSADVTIPGIGLTADYLLKLSRGYDPELVDRRREILRTLLENESSQARAQALAAIRELGRPVIVIADERLHPGLPAWLATVQGVRPIGEQGRISGWLVPATS